MSTTAMKQALEALEYAMEYNRCDDLSERIKQTELRAEPAITSLRQAIEQAEKPKYDTIELHVLHSHIAGVLFDFMGWLTSRENRLTLSSTDEAGPAVEAITEFAKMRSLRLEDAQVEHWQSILTTPQPQREQDESYKAAAYLAKAIFDSLYANKEPYVSGKVVWELCDTTVGVITQIDNMVSQFSPRHQHSQREWVGLTYEERNHARHTVTYSQLAMTAGEWAEAVQIETEKRLKEKNT